MFSSVARSRLPSCVGLKGVFKRVKTRMSGHLLVTWEKVGSNIFGVCRVIFDDNIKKGGFQEVGTTPPIEKALVN